jgi:Leu/Phe-tRNA-protein transferase
MSKKGFRKPRKRDSESIDNFAEGADVHTNVKTSKKQKKEQTQQPFYTTLQPQFKELIQAVAYYERISQREVVEQALSTYYFDRTQKLREAIEAYRNKT